MSRLSVPATQGDLLRAQTGLVIRRKMFSLVFMNLLDPKSVNSSDHRLEAVLLGQDSLQSP